MRLSELQGKEIINIHDGGRLGMVRETELIFDGQTGNVQSIVFPNQGSLFSLFGQQNLIIPWEAIVKIGVEVIIVNFKTQNYDQQLS